MNRNLFNRSLQELRSARTITVCAMMGAAALVLGAYSIYLTPTIKIGFSGLPNLFVAWLFGPSVGMIFNGTMDILKYFMKPVGGFFPPLTLVTMTAGVIYGCFFYGRQLSFRMQYCAQYLLPFSSDRKGILGHTAGPDCEKSDNVAHRFPDFLLCGPGFGECRTVQSLCPEGKK